MILINRTAKNMRKTYLNLIAVTIAKAQRFYLRKSIFNIY